MTARMVGISWRVAACIVIALAFKVTSTVAAGAAADARFVIPREQIIGTVKKIGVMPVSVPALVPDAEAVSARLESEVLARVTAGGFDIVPPQAMRDIRDRARVALGGLYDPMTGAANKEKVDAFQEFTTSEYRLNHPVDATLRVRVLERVAPYSASYANWDGVKDPIAGRSGLGGLLMGGGATGQVPALSLIVQLVGADGKVLYGSYGGLQILQYVTAFMGAVSQRAVDPKFIMRDQARDERALAVALDPLTRGEAGASQAKLQAAPAAVPEAAEAHPVTRAELLQHYRRVALVPLELAAIEQHDRVVARYAELLADRLGKLGFEAVAGDDYTGIWEEERKAVGGFYDPSTGVLDSDKLTKSRRKVYAVMRERHGVDAVVAPVVETRAAPFKSGDAQWDNIRESVKAGKGGLGGLFGPDYFGSLKAYSLTVQLFDIDGLQKFEGSGGIQLLQRLAGSQYVTVPESELFSDPSKDVRAVEIALRALAAPAPGKP
jgi:hypothetical protein